MICPYSMFPCLPLCPWAHREVAPIPPIRYKSSHPSFVPQRILLYYLSILVFWNFLATQAGVCAHGLDTFPNSMHRTPFPQLAAHLFIVPSLKVLFNSESLGLRLLYFQRRIYSLRVSLGLTSKCIASKILMYFLWTSRDSSNLTGFLLWCPAVT